MRWIVQPGARRLVTISSLHVRATRAVRSGGFTARSPTTDPEVPRCAVDPRTPSQRLPCSPRSAPARRPAHARAAPCALTSCRPSARTTAITVRRPRASATRTTRSSPRPATTTRSCATAMPRSHASSGGKVRAASSSTCSAIPRAGCTPSGSRDGARGPMTPRSSSGNEPRGLANAEIATLVRRGYYVRTRSDVPLETVVAGDGSMLDAALANGAQLVSTDFPEIGMSALRQRLRGGAAGRPRASGALQPGWRAALVSRRAPRAPPLSARGRSVGAPRR